MIKTLKKVVSLPRVGKIHLGVKQNGSSKPKATDYFVVHANDALTSPDDVKNFIDVYGEKSSEIDIMFPCDDPEIFFPQFLKLYGDNKNLLCKGDGESAQRFDNEGTKTVKCNPDSCPHYKSGKCKEVANLLVLLPKVKGVGVWQIDTCSYNSIVNLNNAIEFIRKQSKGQISEIPLKLTIRTKSVQIGGKPTEIYVLDIKSDVLISDITVDIATPVDTEPVESVEPIDQEIIQNEVIEEYPEKEELQQLYKVVKTKAFFTMKGWRTQALLERISDGNRIAALIKYPEKLEEDMTISTMIVQMGKWNVVENYQIH